MSALDRRVERVGTNAISDDDDYRHVDSRQKSEARGADEAALRKARTGTRFAPCILLANAPPSPIDLCGIVTEARTLAALAMSHQQS